MARFDRETLSYINSEEGGAALEALGRGDGPAAALGTAFGVPSCMLNLADDVLGLLPAGILSPLRDLLGLGMDRADDVLKGVLQWIRTKTGIMEWETEDGGYTFVSDICKGANDLMGGGLLDGLGALNTALEIGGSLYNNYKSIEGTINAAKECLNTWKQLRKATDLFPSELLDPSSFSDMMAGEYAAFQAQLVPTRNFINRCEEMIGMIDDILRQRSRDPSLEPTFDPSLCALFEGTILEVNCPKQKEITKEIFRLVYGPPKSTQGQFVLSVDGLYYDSQTSGITPVLTHLDNKKRKSNFKDAWKFEQDPNIGGRGKGFSTNDLKLYFNTLLDPRIIDDSPMMREYYDKDGFLQEIILNKSKRIFDLSGQIENLVEDGASISIITNFKQSLMSENTLHQDKVNKRKKQIELAVKIPDLYGTEVRYSPGAVPINDFSYLEGINIALDIEKQKSLIFSQTDISGVVSPIVTKFVVSPKNVKTGSLEHLIIPEMGEGAIIFDGSSVYDTKAPQLSVENSLTTNGLFAMYNFLQTDVETPSSTRFLLRNSASTKDENYAQLVAESPDYVFSKGLGIPYLRGITKHSKTSPTNVSGLGSYVRLPDIQKFNDLLYNPNGATIDFWTHVPELDGIDYGFGDGSVSSLFRLVLANENVGIAPGINPIPDGTEIGSNMGDSFVRGMIMGFTRDRRLTLGLPPSNKSHENPAENISFFIAPTQSLSLSSASFVSKKYYDPNNCNYGSGYHCMTQNIWNTVDGKSLSSCGKEFCHIAVTFDPVNDLVKFYLDGSLTCTSALSEVFGIQKNFTPQIPNFRKANSFEYNTTSVGLNAPTNLKTGPKLDTYFTPWIVGGGYTDGMYNRGNFMGGTYGGITSGLKGYLGSLKFYDRYLSSTEILNNYNTQKDFFKNIDMPNLMWEPIYSM